MTKFNVGDKVRVLNAEAIMFGSKYWKDGDITEVVSFRFGGPQLRRTLGDEFGAASDRMYLEDSELHAVELIKEDDSKINKIEARISELEAEVKALKKSQETKYIGMCLRTEIAKSPKAQLFMTEEFDKAFGSLAKSVRRSVQTPNQRRADVIQRAKMFVADLERRAANDDVNTDGNGVFNRRITKLSFHVNADKGVVTALAKGEYTSKLYAKAFAKCHPNDVFNADIGKAIAAGKLYGVDIPQEFLDAPNPTEVVDYMKVVTDDGLYTVTPGDYCEDTHGTKECQADSIYAIEGTIIEDTDAVYS